MAESNWKKVDWSKESWTCARCGAPATKATHHGAGGPNPGPYNRTQRYCADDCAGEAADERAEARAAERRQQRMAAWSCAYCGGPSTEFVRGRRRTCSMRCAAKLRNQHQEERRMRAMLSSVGAALERRGVDTTLSKRAPT